MNPVHLFLMRKNMSFNADGDFAGEVNVNDTVTYREDVEARGLPT